MSNLGLLVMAVSAAWSMTQMTSSASMVALVQTALMMPVALIATPAGAVADMFDRRILGLVALAIALLGAVLMTALAWLGIMTPDLLLALCFTVGSGMALFGPAWQASVSEQVPAEALPSAVALNSISYNIAPASARRLAGSLSLRRVRSQPSQLMPYSIFRLSSSCISGDACKRPRAFRLNGWRARSFQAFATS
jgi:MFS family permease